LAYGQNMFRDSVKTFEENTRTGRIETYKLSELSGVRQKRNVSQLYTT